MKSTMIELVEELEKLPKSSNIDFMIKEAKAGEYHDYKNKKYLCGKMESSQRLRKLGYPDLAKRIESGEFDEQADDLDKQAMRNDLDLSDSPMDRKLKEILGL